MPIFKSENDATIEVKGLTAKDIGAIPIEQKGIPGGLATLGMDGRVPAHQLPNWSELLTVNLQATDALAIQVENLPAPPTLASLNGEPSGAEARAKTYTDQKISQIPALTPAQIGAIAKEEKGAPTGLATLGADGVVLAGQLPSPPTLTQLGGEPVGAESRSKVYTDTQLANFLLPIRSRNIPTNLRDGQEWIELDEAGFPLHSWLRMPDGFISFQPLSFSGGIATSATAKQTREWAIPISGSQLKPFVQLNYLRTSFSTRSPQSTTNYWTLQMLNVKTNGATPSLGSTTTQARTINSPENWNLTLGNLINMYNDTSVIRFDATATGTPGGLFLTYHVHYSLRAFITQ